MYIYPLEHLNKVTSSSFTGKSLEYVGKVVIQLRSALAVWSREASVELEREEIREKLRSKVCVSFNPFEVSSWIWRISEGAVSL